MYLVPSYPVRNRPSLLYHLLNIVVSNRDLRNPYRAGGSEFGGKTPEGRTDGGVPVELAGAFLWNRDDGLDLRWDIRVKVTRTVSVGVSA